MRFITGSVLFCALVASGGCGKKKVEAAAPPVPVKVETVATQDVRQSWRYSGQILAKTQVKLAFKQAGYVSSLHKVRDADGHWRDIQVGDSVPAGTVLARVRQNEYQASLNQAIGQERSMGGSLGSSQADLEQAKASREKAELDFKRAESLYAAKAMTRPDYDEAVNQYHSALAKVDGSLKMIDSRRGQLTAAEAQVTSARIALNETNLTTLMPCVIVTKEVEPGTLVSNGTTGFTVADTRTVKVEFGVPDTILAHFKMGAPVPVNVDGLQAGQLTGRITEISASADTDTRVFKIQVSLPNPHYALKVGMIASVQVLDNANIQQLPLVPATALSTTQSGSTNFSVFVLHDDNGKQVAQLRSVRIGETIGRSIAIKEGLTPGERIITNRPNQLSDGSEVRVIN
jgi:RND family efflux transporter MFP subunit